MTADRAIDLSSRRDAKEAGAVLAKLNCDLTDVGNRNRLIALHGDNIRHTPDGWKVWNGAYWESDDGLCAITERVVDTALAIRSEAAAFHDKERFGEIIKHALRSESASRIKAVTDLASRDPRIQAFPSDFDLDPLLFNCGNGTLNLKTGKLQEHRREDFISQISPVYYEPAAECPLWYRFTDQTCMGDGARVDYLQETLGYSLTGRTTDQCFFLPHGPGENGKGVLFRVFQFLLGSYAQSIPFESLLKSVHADGGRPRPDLAGLVGARFVTASESDVDAQFSAALMKTLTGEDRIAVRGLWKNFFEYTPQFKVWLATNRLPRLKDTGHAMWRRVKVIPFDFVVPSEERDPDLADKLIKEASGILNWVLVGCLRWQARGTLPITEAISTATKKYQSTEDVFGAFLSDSCHVAAEEHCTSAALRGAYEGWCKEHGEKAFSGRAMAAVLQERGFTKTRSRKARGWKGLSILSDYDKV